MWVAVGLSVALAPIAARAHGSRAVLVGLALVPAAGAELEVIDGRPEGRLLLSWPFQIPVHPDELGLDTSVHRVVVSPELRLIGGVEIGGRVGYRWNRPHYFAGLGASYSDSLSVCASPEVGYRFFSEHGFHRSIPFFVAVRADVPVTSEFGRRWAASLSVGWSTY